MKKLLLAATLFFIATSGHSQANYTGSYGYSLQPEGTPAKNEKASGPSGSLVLIRLEGNKYRFWLDVDKGWPSYNLGSTNGTITFKNDTASFDNTWDGAKKSCILKFRISKNVVHITSQSASGDCGFGNAVLADGSYTKWKVQPKLNNTWLKDQYFESPKVMTTANKTTLYKDENALYATAQTFAKGETLLNIAETEKTIYTEWFTSSGKFVYGWIKKTACKMFDTN